MVTDAQQQAEHMVTEARQQAEHMVTEARQQAEALDAERQHTHQRLRDLHERLGAVISDAASP
jgi:cell division septum initiation protein DivIVA